MRVSREFRRPLLFILFTTCCISLFIVFIPPENIGFILGFLFFVGLLLYGISRIWLQKRFSILFSVFIISVLLLNAVSGFDTINIILLISLFVGITILLQ